MNDQQLLSEWLNKSQEWKTTEAKLLQRIAELAEQNSNLNQFYEGSKRRIKADTKHIAELEAENAKFLADLVTAKNENISLKAISDQATQRTQELETQLATWTASRQASDDALIAKADRIAELEAHITRQEKVIRQYLEEPINLSVLNVIEIIDLAHNDSGLRTPD